MLLLVGVGFLGGFTTFSAFGYETISLLRGGKVGLAGVNVLAQILLGVAAAWIGVMVASDRSPGTL
ncbi:MAG: putative fluoride ion transporter CrcB [Fimbriimonadaceae bacterium]|nr:putative fluoride ion transporter CrcB [Fimbriimonadaceae bacterium]